MNMVGYERLDEGADKAGCKGGVGYEAKGGRMKMLERGLRQGSGFYYFDINKGGLLHNGTDGL